MIENKDLIIVSQQIGKSGMEGEKMPYLKHKGTVFQYLYRNFMVDGSL